jgi:hypothetical protein
MYDVQQLSKIRWDLLIAAVVGLQAIIVPLEVHTLNVYHFSMYVLAVWRAIKPNKLCLHSRCTVAGLQCSACCWCARAGVQQ